MKLKDLTKTTLDVIARMREIAIYLDHVLESQLWPSPSKVRSRNSMGATENVKITI